MAFLEVQFYSRTSEFYNIRGVDCLSGNRDGANLRELRPGIMLVLTANWSYEYMSLRRLQGVVRGYRRNTTDFTA